MIETCSVRFKGNTSCAVKNISMIVVILAAGFMAACSSIPQHHDQITKQKTSTVIVKSTIPEHTDPQSIKSNGGYYLNDGPGENPPDDLHLIPDAQPKHEPLRALNMQPYVAMGKQYKPMTALQPYKQRGIASWYGRRYHGNNTASGEAYDMYAMTAAHPTLPLPSYVRVTNLDNGKSVIVRLNDRGPFLSNRLIDLSYTAAYKLGIIGNGSGRVEVESILPERTTESTEPSAPRMARSTSTTTIDQKSVFLQLGAFGSSDNANSFLAQMHQKLPTMRNTIGISKTNGLYKIQVGPYPNQVLAKMDEDMIRQQLGFKPLWVID